MVAHLRLVSMLVVIVMWSKNKKTVYIIRYATPKQKQSWVNIMKTSYKHTRITTLQPHVQTSHNLLILGRPACPIIGPTVTGSADTIFLLS